MASTMLPKPSFAKVAAASLPTKMPRLGPGAADAAAANKETAPAPSSAPGLSSARDAQKPACPASPVPPNDALAEAVSQLAIAGPPGLIVDGSSLSDNTKSAAAESDDSHRTDCSELGTKPPSLDGKSVTSGTTTTFALDEKDSLRPDDSASVQAAADDDDSSIRGSLLASSRAPPFYPRASIDARTPGGNAQIHTPSDPDSDPASVAAEVPSNTLNNIYQQAPDDKLLEAIESAKDRQFLLRLEVDVINFVQESKEPYMDLPPSNSFFRMLTHKLADYYHMTHSYEKDNGPGFVRIFRTPFCRVPPSLASFVAITKSPTPPPPILPMKIMRRGEDSQSDTLASSSASQSKAASDVGGAEQKEKTAIKERKTREEREEAYNEARKRIFGTSSSTPAAANSVDNTSEVEADNGISRASSVSTKDKSTANSRRTKNPKQRRDSGTFESRHNYVQQWSHPQQWGSQPQPHYVPIGSLYQSPQGPPPNQNQQLSSAQQPYTNQSSAAYSNGAGQATGPIPNAHGYSHQAYCPGGQYLPHAPAGRYPQQGHSPAPYGHNASPQQWQSGPNPRPTHYGRGGMPSNAAVGPNGIHYPFGQLPMNVNPYDAKSQHPIPGSYNRPGFTLGGQAYAPDTRNPSCHTMGQPPPHPQMQPMYPGPSNQHMSPRMDNYAPVTYAHSPPMNYAQPCIPPPYATNQHMPPQIPGYGPLNMMPYPHQQAQSHHNYSQYSHHAQSHNHPAAHPASAKVLSANNEKQAKPAAEINKAPSASTTASSVSAPVVVSSPASALPTSTSATASASPTGKPTVGQGVSGQPFGNLPHYGNPATLPQKPI
ncbi:hypothetical protein BROUX41_006161 [Berkeleyomyces rouxiae]|uniref:uncharacterized protein n=1 Tax=Berkeleyomyces rouxiae TaxID=2035830 RepID=UPI003B7C5049